MLMHHLSTNANCIAMVLLLLMAVSRSAESLNMTVRVELNPTPSSKLPLCSLPFLQAFQPNLTSWVVGATALVIPDFNLTEDLTLTFHDLAGNGRRFLRVTMIRDQNNYDLPVNRDRDLLDTALAASASSSSLASSSTSSSTTCTACSSSGCTTNCGSATCRLCSGSRRATKLVRESEILDGDERALAATDFNALGKNVSAAVKSMARSFLADPSISVAAGGCLGKTNSLSVSVTFMVNQAFRASNFRSLNETYQTWKKSGY